MAEGATSKQAIQDTVNNFKDHGPIVGAIQTAAQVIVRSATDVTLFDLVILTIVMPIPSSLIFGIVFLVDNFRYGSRYIISENAPSGYTAPAALASQSTSCYYKSLSGVATYTIELPMKGANPVGVPPTRLDEIGQTTSWIDTNLVTTGEVIEIAVNGSWYPFGLSNTDMIMENKPVSYISSGVGSSSTGLISYLQPTQVYKKCVMTTNWDQFAQSDDKDFNRQRKENQLSRFAKTTADNIPWKEQISYIKDIHCLDDACNTRRAPDDKDFTSCYMTDGNAGRGIYMKLGAEANYAYEIGGYDVLAHETYWDAVLEENVKIIYSGGVGGTGDGKAQPYHVNFTLPTRIYNQGYHRSSFVQSTPLDRRLQYANFANTPYAQLSTVDCQALKDGTLPKTIAFNTPAETCLQPAGQRIYLKPALLNYTVVDGNIQITFKSGAKPYTGIEYNTGVRAPKTSFLQVIAFFIMNPLYGNQNIDNYKDGAILDPSEIQTGLIMTVRNAILKSFSFQLLRHIGMMLVIVMYGREIITGKEHLTPTVILHRFTGIALAYFATNPNNYVLLDDFLFNIYFNFAPSIMATFWNAMIGGGQLSLSGTNPFTSFDTMIMGMFAPRTSHDFMALFIQTPLFLIVFPSICALILTSTTQIFKMFLTLLVGILLLGIVWLLMPFVLLAFILGEKGYTKAALTSGIEKPMLSSIFFGMVVSIIVGIAFQNFNAMLNGYDMCWEKVLTFPLFGFITINIYGWKIHDFDNIQFLTSFGKFMLGVALIQQHESFTGALTSLFGGSGVYAQGKGFLSSVMGATVDAVTLGPMGKVGSAMFPKAAKFGSGIIQNVAGVIDPTKSTFMPSYIATDKKKRTDLFNQFMDNPVNIVQGIGRGLASQGLKEMRGLAGKLNDKARKGVSRGVDGAAGNMESGLKSEGAKMVSDMKLEAARKGDYKTDVGAQMKRPLSGVGKEVINPAQNVIPIKPIKQSQATTKPLDKMKAKIGDIRKESTRALQIGMKEDNGEDIEEIAEIEELGKKKSASEKAKRSALREAEKIEKRKNIRKRKMQKKQSRYALRAINAAQNKRQIENAEARIMQYNNINSRYNETKEDPMKQVGANTYPQDITGNDKPIGIAEERSVLRQQEAEKHAENMAIAGGLNEKLGGLNISTQSGLSFKAGALDYKAGVFMDIGGKKEEDKATPTQKQKQKVLQQQAKQRKEKKFEIDIKEMALEVQQALDSAKSADDGSKLQKDSIELLNEKTNKYAELLASKKITFKAQEFEFTDKASLNEFGDTMLKQVDISTMTFKVRNVRDKKKLKEFEKKHGMDKK